MRPWDAAMASPEPSESSPFQPNVTSSSYAGISWKPDQENGGEERVLLKKNKRSSDQPTGTSILLREKRSFLKLPTVITPLLVLKYRIL